MGSYDTSFGENNFISRIWSTWRLVSFLRFFLTSLVKYRLSKETQWFFQTFLKIFIILDNFRFRISLLINFWIYTFDYVFSKRVHKSRIVVTSIQIIATFLSLKSWFSISRCHADFLGLHYLFKLRILSRRVWNLCISFAIKSDVLSNFQGFCRRFDWLMQILVYDRISLIEFWSLRFLSWWNPCISIRTPRS